jgi:hypothetical protein
MRSIKGTITEYGIENQLTSKDVSVETPEIPHPLAPKPYVLGYFDQTGNPQLITKGFETREQADEYNDRWYGGGNGFSAFSVFKLSATD